MIIRFEVLRRTRRKTGDCGDVDFFSANLSKRKAKVNVQDATGRDTDGRLDVSVRDSGDGVVGR